MMILAAPLPAHAPPPPGSIYSHAPIAIAAGRAASCGGTAGGGTCPCYGTVPPALMEEL